MTNSIAFPNMFNPTNNKVNTLSGNNSIVNRTRLLILTEPTELYNSPTFGVGLKRYLWQYNTDNTKAMIEDRIKEQVAIYEPACIAEQTSFADGLLFSSDDSTEVQSYNQLKLTVGLKTIYGDDLQIDTDNKE